MGKKLGFKFFGGRLNKKKDSYHYKIAQTAEMGFSKKCTLCRFFLAGGYIVRKFYKGEILGKVSGSTCGNKLNIIILLK